MSEAVQMPAPATSTFHREAPGVTPASNPERRGAFLADVIVELGFADRETVEQAELAARQAERRVEDHMLASGLLDEVQLSLAVAERNGLDHVDLERFDVDLDAAGLIDRAAAERYGAVPIAFADDGSLVVAVGDPLDTLGVSDIEVMTKSEVCRVIAAPGEIRSTIERLPKRAPRKEAQIMELEPEVPTVPTTQETPTDAEAPSPALGVGPPPEPQPVAPSEPQPVVPSGPHSVAPPEPPAAPPPEQPKAGEAAAEQPRAESAATPSDLSTELEALREEASRANELAAAVGRRIEELSGAEERAQQLDGELATARERISELEQRVSGMDAAVLDVREATETLRSLRRTLDTSAG